MLNRNSFAGMAIVVGVAVFSMPASGDHSWGGYHWARTTPSFTLQVVSSVTPDWQWELGESLAQWSYSEVVDFNSNSSSTSKKTRKRCRMVQGQMRVCNDRYGSNGWLGLASIGITTGGHIDQGTVKVNDTYSSYWQDQAEKNHVMCQEVGHVLGLDHTSEDGSSQQTCMDYSSDPASQWPNAHDYEQLAIIYTHPDSFDSYDGGSGGGGGDGGGGNDKPCNAPPGKGCNKNNAGVPPMGSRVHRGENHELWVAPRRGGGLWVHHVTLVRD